MSFTRRLPTRVKSYRLMLVALVVSVGIILGTLSVLRYVSYNAKMADIGHMSQAIWSATKGRPLEYTRESGESPTFSRLAWHAELVYFIVAGIYRLVPTPITLLVLQAGWFAIGAFPVYAIAEKRLGHGLAALGVACIYLSYPVAQTAVLFDFHGDTLAMPVLLFAIWAFERRRWRTLVFWMVFALSCKICAAAPVAFMGWVMWRKGFRKAGVWTAACSLLWVVVLLVVVRPRYSSGMSSEAHNALGAYLNFYFSWGVEVAATFAHRVIVLAIVLLPVLMIVPCAPTWFVPALAVIVPAILSNGPGPSYHYAYHHYALAVPFLVMALIDGVDRLNGRGGRVLGKLARTGRWVPLSWLCLVFALFVTLVLNLLFVDTPLNPRFWTSDSAGTLLEMTYQPTPRDRFKTQWLADSVPAEVPIAASVTLAPHLANRQILFTSYNMAQNLDYLEYAVFDSLFDHVALSSDGVFLGGAMFDVPAIRLLIEDGRFQVVDQRDGLILLSRGGSSAGSLQQRADVLSQLPTPGRVRVAEYGEAIALLEVDIDYLGEQRYRLRFDWLAVSALSDRAPLFAVSRVRELGAGRWVHLPTQVLMQTPSWPSNRVIREIFDIELPANAPPGSYPLQTAWYDSAVDCAYSTDECSRVGEEFVVADLRVPNVGD